jgi:hypothetical protein
MPALQSGLGEPALAIRDPGLVLFRFFFDRMCADFRATLNLGEPAMPASRFGPPLGTRGMRTEGGNYSIRAKSLLPNPVPRRELPTTCPILNTFPPRILG